MYTLEWLNCQSRILTDKTLRKNDVNIRLLRVKGNTYNIYVRFKYRIVPAWRNKPRWYQRCPLWSRQGTKMMSGKVKRYSQATFRKYHATRQKFIQNWLKQPLVLLSASRAFNHFLKEKPSFALHHFLWLYQAKKDKDNKKRGEEKIPSSHHCKRNEIMIKECLWHGTPSM